MRKSLSQNQLAASRAATSAVVLSAVLVLAAVVDHVGVHSLGEHAVALYAPYGVAPQPGVLYGLLYAVAIVGALLWFLVVRAVRRGRRSAPILAGGVAAITAALAAVLLGSSEYGVLIFPAQWGALALLPPAAGAVAVLLLLRRRPIATG